MNGTIEHVQAAAFDLDGTLCDSLPDLAAAANAMRASLDLPPLPQPTVESYVGDGIAVLVHRALTGNVDGRAEEELWAQGFTLFVQYYAEHIADRTRAYPETEAGLGLLKSLGIPLAVITNKNEVLAVKLLEALGLSDYFSLVLGGDSLPESIGVTFGYGDMAELSKHEATRPDWTIGSLPEIYENLRPQREEKEKAV